MGDDALEETRLSNGVLEFHLQTLHVISRRARIRPAFGLEDADNLVAFDIVLQEAEGTHDGSQGMEPVVGDDRCCHRVTQDVPNHEGRVENDARPEYVGRLRKDPHERPRRFLVHPLDGPEQLRVHLVELDLASDKDRDDVLLHTAALEWLEAYEKLLA